MNIRQHHLRCFDFKLSTCVMEIENIDGTTNTQTQNNIEKLVFYIEQVEIERGISVTEIP